MGLFSKKEENKEKGAKAKLSDAERLDDGQLQVRFIIEMLGKPKEHLEKTFNELMQKLASEEKAAITRTNYSKIKKQGELFARYAEIELWAEDLSTIIGLCFDYMPSSVEVIRPEQVVYPIHRLNGYLNELQAKLHHVDMLAKNAQTEKAILASNLFKMMGNIILICVATGAKTKEEISRLTGLKGETLDGPLKNMVEEKKIKKDGEKYALVR